MTGDLALIYSIMAHGPDAFFKARDRGVKADFLFDAAKTVFCMFEEFVVSTLRLPTVEEIKLKTGVSLDPAVDGTKFDPTLCIDIVVANALRNAINNGLSPIIRLNETDAGAAKAAMSSLVDSLEWSRGEVYTANSVRTRTQRISRYEEIEAKTKAGGLRGYSSPWPSMDKMSLGLQAGELTIILAKKKIGKSASASTILYDPHTGRESTLGALYERQRGDVLTWEKNKQIRVATPTGYLDSGIKPAVRITYRSGRTIEPATTHPFLTPRGWIEAGSLKVGQHTAAVRKYPEPLKPQAMYQDEIKVLAYMIADGGCTKPSTPTWTKNDPAIMKDFEQSVQALGGALSPIKDAPGNYYVVADKAKARNPIVALLEEFKLLRKKSVTKVLPDEVFSLDDEQLGIFLGCLWSGDGTVQTDGQVSYSTGSHKMALQVQHLLLRFGITSKVRDLARDTDHGTYYEVVIHREWIESFKQHIPLVGEKAVRLSDVTFKGRSRVGWIKNEEIRDLVEREVAADRSLLKDVGEALGYDFHFQIGHAFPSNSGRVCRKVFEAFCEVYNSDLKWILDENIWWDEVATIEPIGDVQCYDLSVPPTENFIANDFVVHNTWLKLAWADHIMRTDLKPGEKLLFASMEMPKEQVNDRLEALHLRLDYELFRSGKLPNMERDRYYTYLKRKDLPEPDFVITDSVDTPTMRDLAAVMARVKPKIVFIDGLYIFQRKANSEWERMLGNVTDAKLKLAAGFGIPVVASSQISGKKSRDTLNADTDDAGYAKAIGEYADATRGLFASKEHEAENRRIFRGLESRDFKPVDLLMNFNLRTMDFSEIRVLESDDPENNPPGNEDGDDDEGGGGGGDKRGGPRGRPKNDAPRSRQPILSI